ncbi:hypothetical protein [Amycolatopsis keratiniphila]|uniref:Uncharacterized protein n=1 Tax=Amycolatopsis keratiniphila subsp. keratiniphila TaxID=227715 RepID=A0A1W2LNL9_9PSEU|nr:hypothetical protein [Amycolatopsis keratiniphila]OLZ52179.1 hypothetical protein BS330_26575 [Amycolatopsis keratiniphila subsp. nogabecina]ONF64407.1 hypothetical protein AVR91_0229595 [Amycolatopsis keratiniphila subsp. keratiniphila]SDU60337.1 hypothetical protein SAMN04489733_6849 [Amycolatopsis keratiniphila]
MPTPLRVAIAVQTLAVFLTPISAGLLLTVPSGHTLHSATAYTLFVVATLHVLVAILVWRPGGGSAKPILPAAVFLGLTLVQVFLGIAHVTAVHVPLGVLLFGFSLVQLSRITPLPREAAVTAAP